MTILDNKGKGLVAVTERERRVGGILKAASANQAGDVSKPCGLATLAWSLSLILEEAEEMFTPTHTFRTTR